jgi:hypothetical protein
VLCRYGASVATNGFGGSRPTDPVAKAVAKRDARTENIEENIEEERSYQPMRGATSVGKRFASWHCCLAQHEGHPYLSQELPASTARCLAKSECVRPGLSAYWLWLTRIPLFFGPPESPRVPRLGQSLPQQPFRQTRPETITDAAEGAFHHLFEVVPNRERMHGKY